MLTENIRNEVPDIFELYQKSTLVDRTEKYQFFKDAADKATKNIGIVQPCNRTLLSIDSDPNYVLISKEA